MENLVLENIRNRRSVRAYKPDAVPQNLLDAVLEAGTYAPTGGGRQSPVIIAVKSAEYRKKIAELDFLKLANGQRLRPVLRRADDDFSACRRKRDYGRGRRELCA